MLWLREGNLGVKWHLQGYGDPPPPMGFDFSWVLTACVTPTGVSPASAAQFPPAAGFEGEWRGRGESSKRLQAASLHALMCARSQPGLKGQRLPQRPGFLMDVHPCSPFPLKPHFFSLKNEVFRTFHHRSLFVCGG